MNHKREKCFASCMKVFLFISKVPFLKFQWIMKILQRYQETDWEILQTWANNNSRVFHELHMSIISYLTVFQNSKNNGQKTFEFWTWNFWKFEFWTWYFWKFEFWTWNFWKFVSRKILKNEKSLNFWNFFLMDSEEPPWRDRKKFFVYLYI